MIEFYGVRHERVQWDGDDVGRDERAEAARDSNIHVKLYSIWRTFSARRAKSIFAHCSRYLEIKKMIYDRSSESLYSKMK